MAIQNSFPLQWPSGWPRTEYPNPSRFEPGSPYAESFEVVKK